MEQAAPCRERLAVEFAMRRSHRMPPRCACVATTEPVARRRNGTAGRGPVLPAWQVSDRIARFDRLWSIVTPGGESRGRIHTAIAHTTEASALVLHGPSRTLGGCRQDTYDDCMVRFGLCSSPNDASALAEMGFDYAEWPVRSTVGEMDADAYAELRRTAAGLP